MAEVKVTINSDGSVSVEGDIKDLPEHVQRLVDQQFERARRDRYYETDNDRDDRRGDYSYHN